MLYIDFDLIDYCL